MRALWWRLTRRKRHKELRRRLDAAPPPEPRDPERAGQALAAILIALTEASAEKPDGAS